ncbi:MAG: hypothetical protein ACFFFT_01970 [Candidatus Thorarchaeota archaeon]
MAKKLLKHRKQNGKKEYLTRIKELIEDDLKWQEYYNRIESVVKKVDVVEPVFFNSGEAGFYYKLNADTEITFHLRSDDEVLEYFVEYQGEPEEYDESPYNRTVQDDIKYIKEIIELYS